jgi:hypothetical protein
MGEQSHEGGGNSNHRKLPDQVEQHEAKPPKTAYTTRVRPSASIMPLPKKVPHRGSSRLPMP